MLILELVYLILNKDMIQANLDLKDLVVLQQWELSSMSQFPALKKQFMGLGMSEPKAEETSY